MSSVQEQPQRGLLRSLSLTHAVLYGLGVTIGAGIYVLVGVMADRGGMHAPMAFLVAAVPMALSAASFAELGTRMPVSASEAAYVQAAFNRNWLSLSVGFLVVATATISAAMIASGIIHHLHHLTTMAAAAAWRMLTTPLRLMRAVCRQWQGTAIDSDCRSDGKLAGLSP